MRTLAFVAAVVTTFGAPACAIEAIRLAPGATTQITLKENPSTGYSWRLDRAASQGVGAVVAVVDGGHKQAARPASAPPIAGAPGVRLWTIRGIRDGAATVVFTYRRPWESASIETRRYPIRVGR